jgi:hypothetical protein
MNISTIITLLCHTRRRDDTLLLLAKTTNARTKWLECSRVVSKKKRNGSRRNSRDSDNRTIEWCHPVLF